jgi:hypothetical protein
MNPRPSGLIELRLNNVGQLFNTMDPSPVHERDLDHDAEEFILSWAREHEKDSELLIRVVLRQPEDAEAARLVRESIQHYFGYRARIARRDLAELFREGRTALLIGLLFLAREGLSFAMLRGMGAQGQADHDAETAPTAAAAAATRATSPRPDPPHVGKMIQKLELLPYTWWQH